MPVCGGCERLGLECRPSEFIAQSRQRVSPTPNQLSSFSPQRHSTASPLRYSPTDVLNIGSSRLTTLITNDDNSLSLLANQTPTTEDLAATANTRLQSRLLQSAKEPMTLTDEAVQLLTHYRGGMAKWMDVFDHNCTYQRELCKRAVASKRLLNCICAFAAKQLSLLPSGRIWEQKATEYYTRSLNLLIRQISDDEDPSEALSAIMILSSYEVIASQGPEHQRHFEGAMTLIRSRGISARSSGLDRANFWVYVRHEIVVALVSQRPLQLSTDQWHLDWQDMSPLQEDMLANYLLWLVGRAIDLKFSQKKSDLDVKTLIVDIRAWFDGLVPTFRGLRHGSPTEAKVWFPVPSAGAYAA